MKHKFARCLAVALLGAGLWLASPLIDTAAHACPNCKELAAAENTGNSSGATGLAEGYFWSIIVMLAVPYSLFAGGAIVAYLTYRKHQAKVNQQDIDATLPASR